MIKQVETFAWIGFHPDFVKFIAGIFATYAGFFLAGWWINDRS